MADEARMVFYIPVNFAEEGTVLGGRLKSRNAAETILSLVLLLQPVFALRVGTKMKVYLAVLIVLPVCIFSAIGIQGESLSSFLMGVLCFFRTRRIWGKPDRGYRMELDWKGQKKKKQSRRQRESGSRRKFSPVDPGFREVWDGFVKRTEKKRGEKK